MTSTGGEVMAGGPSDDRVRMLRLAARRFGSASTGSTTDARRASSKFCGGGDVSWTARRRRRVLRVDLRGRDRSDRRNARQRGRRVRELLADLCLEGEEHRMLRLDVTEPLEHRSCADQIAELTPRDRAGLREKERRVAVLAGMRDRLFGEREHAIPVAAFATVGVAQVVERALVLGIELDRLLEELRAGVDVLMTRDPARPEDVSQPRAALPVLLALEDLRLESLELIELAPLAHHALEERCGLLRRRICGVRALQHVEEIVRREAARDARGAQEEAALRRTDRSRHARR